jgi:hypothetical protein
MVYQTFTDPESDILALVRPAFSQCPHPRSECRTGNSDALKNKIKFNKNIYAKILDIFDERFEKTISKNIWLARKNNEMNGHEEANRCSYGNR